MIIRGRRKPQGFLGRNQANKISATFPVTSLGKEERRKHSSLGSTFYINILSVNREKEITPNLYSNVNSSLESYTADV